MSAYEVGLDACETELEENCKWLALRHSFLSYLKVVFWFKTTKVSKDNAKFIYNFSKEIREKISESLNKSKEQDK